MTTPRSDVGDALKLLVETLSPDLRPFFRPSLLGRVVSVNEAEYWVDVVVGGDPETGDGGLALPDVPVASLFAQDGYGIWALPEVDAEVTVSFHDGDVTRPYVESPIFYNNEAPSGFTTGTIAIRGKQGQKIEMKPATSEIVLSAGSVKLVSTEKRQEQTEGDSSNFVNGARQDRVAGADGIEADSWNVTINRAAVLDVGSLSEITKGDLLQQVGGAHNQSVGGSVSRQVAGGVSECVTFSKRQVIGGAYEILVAATPGIAPVPPGAAYAILVSLGNLALDAAGGEVNIGADVLTPPLFVNVGSAVSGPVQLGGVGASGQPAACGLPLQIVLSTILNVLKTVPLGIGNLGSPISPNPAMAAALAAADTAMTSLLSGKVYISQV